MEECIKKLSRFQYSCNFATFEIIFGNKENANHMFEKFITLNRNLLTFSEHLDQENFTTLLKYINDNIKLK